jgi:hypothetical protein
MGIVCFGNTPIGNIAQRRLTAWDLIKYNFAIEQENSQTTDFENRNENVAEKRHLLNLVGQKDIGENWQVCS